MGLRDQQARMQAQQALAEEQAQTLLEGRTLPTTHHSQHIVDIALHNEVEKIRTMPSLEIRADYKRAHFLPKWLPFVEQHFNKGDTHQNDVIGYCIIYLFDVGRFEHAIEMADRAITNGQRLPERFKSTIPTFVADQIYRWTEKTAAVGGNVEPYFSQILEKVSMHWSLHEYITAKWLKLAATLLVRTADGKAHAASYNEPERLHLAIQLCNRAFQLNHKVGVKNLVERCQMRLTKLADIGIAEPSQAAGLALNTSDIDIPKVIQLLNAKPLSLKEVLAKYKGEGDV
ncbi:hypothetical protein RO21_06075 [[Actinobacillus] muris]|uniref:Terminase n=1 Tax=Muribacter muris TaxID=67855 RepID=A0A0J5P7L2_9PAST|nr:phage terminase small subunit [Muribacter muris]KMK51479.1 hypothetical protein RO21_06075 [[Actinobacillus] muris] [Muribacter muris]